MHTHARRLAAAIGALALIACSDRVDPVTALIPTALDSVPVSLSATASVPDCGFENGAACPGLESGPRCDHGLQVENRGTLKPGDDVCINDTRHLVGAGFRGSWVDWALANQRTLAIDEPINWVMHLTTHNAFNNVTDHLRLLDLNERLDPNQAWSMSDQLDLGSRMLWLDLHWSFARVRLCHAQAIFENIPVLPELHLGCLPRDRRFAYAIQEIAAWLVANPDEIILIDLEAYVEEQFDDVADPLKTFFGAMLYRTSDRTNVSSPWPSRRELLTMGKRVIVVALGGRDPPHYVGDNFRSTTHDGAIPVGQMRFIKHFEVEKTDGIVTKCTTIKEDPPVGRQTLLVRDHLFRVVGEDRTTYSLSRSPDHHHHVGVVHSDDAANLAACGLSLVSLDMLSASRGDFGRPIVRDDSEHPDRFPSEELQRYLVWSWREGDRGGAGDAALLRGVDGRWTSAAPSGRQRFACGRPRSETSRRIANWTDSLGTEWRVTSREGTWNEGGRACLDEYGDEGFVFAVPVNGYTNGQLRLADQVRGDVWLNYNDIKQEGNWIINQRPLANAGANQVVECSGHNGTLVQLDGRLSSDPDADQLTLEWQGPFGTVTGAQPTVLLPLGTHVIRMIADDGFAGVSVDEVVIEVVDTTPPEIRSASATPSELWAPNHKMVPVGVTVDVHDICDPTPTCRIVSVASNEPANGVGDGNTAPDWEITGALTVNLRAERSGSGNGRVYTITVQCTDASGNAATTEVTVSVPHDQGKP
jgi:hypothetical protein